MALSEFGIELDRKGYAPSILQNTEDQCRCYLCRRMQSSWLKLDRHEVYGGMNRDKAKEYGLWVMLCHNDCHEGPHGVHLDRTARLTLRRKCQRIAMLYYGWTEEDFRARFGKSYLPLGKGREDGKC